MIFSIKKASVDGRYIPSLCEKIFLEHNIQESTQIKGMPVRMIFESKIWAVGELLRQDLRSNPIYRNNNTLLTQIIEIVKITKYRSGRESFVMLFHLFGNSMAVKEILIDLLYDEVLYGYSVREMNKMKLYIGGDRIKELLQVEKTAWKKKELKKNIDNEILMLRSEN